MRHIGQSIQEAIDWTQDRLATTRPLAERTLFALLAEQRVRETEDGFLLNEDTEDEPQKIHKRLQTKHAPMRHRPRSHRMQKHLDLKRMREFERRLVTTLDDPPTVEQQKRLDKLRQTQRQLQQTLESKDGDAIS